MTLTVQPVNPFKIPPWRPYEPFTSTNGLLTKEAAEYLNSIVRRAGGTIGPMSADVLQGQTWEEPGPLGKTTPNTAKVTFFEAIRDVNIIPQAAPADPGLGIPISIGKVVVNPQTSGTIDNVDIGPTVPKTGKFTSLQATGAFSCNGAAPQGPATVGALVSTTGATNTTPYGFTTAAQANDIVAKLNAVITALKANGIAV